MTSGRWASIAPSSAASTSCTVTAIPSSPKTPAIRRPDRSDTSRSWDKPPAIIMTSRGGEPGAGGTGGFIASESSTLIGASDIHRPRGSTAAPGGAGHLDELLLRAHDPGQAPHALADPLRRGIAEGQPHVVVRSEEYTSELQSRGHLVCRLLLEKQNIILKLLK